MSSVTTIRVHGLSSLVRSLLSGYLDDERAPMVQPPLALLRFQTGSDGEPFRIERVPLWHPASPITVPVWHNSPPQLAERYTDDSSSAMDNERTVYALAYAERTSAFWFNPQPSVGVETRLLGWLGEPMPETWVIGESGTLCFEQPIELTSERTELYGSFRVCLPEHGLVLPATQAYRLCAEGESRFAMLKRADSGLAKLTRSVLPSPRTYVYFKPSQYYGTRVGHLLCLDSRDVKCYSDLVAVLASLCGYTALEPADNILLLASFVKAAGSLSSVLMETARASTSLLLLQDMFTRLNDEQRSLFLKLYSLRVSERYRLSEPITHWYAGKLRYPVFSSSSRLRGGIESVYDTLRVLASQLGNPLPRWRDLDWQQYLTMFDEALR